MKTTNLARYKVSQGTTSMIRFLATSNLNMELNREWTDFENADWAERSSKQGSAKVAHVTHALLWRHLHIHKHLLHDSHFCKACIGEYSMICNSSQSS
jgi:hypothetical protein